MIDTSQEPSRESLSTRDALEHLRSAGLPPDDNCKRPAQWAAAGLLPARAFFLRNRNERSPESSLVPTWVWREVVEGLWVRLLDWQAGSLRLLRYNVGPTLDIEAHGIEFDKAALFRLAPRPGPTEAETVAPEADRSTGRPTGSGEHSRTDESLFPRIQASWMRVRPALPRRPLGYCFVRVNSKGRRRSQPSREWCVNSASGAEGGNLSSLSITFRPLNALKSPDGARIFAESPPCSRSYQPQWESISGTPYHDHRRRD